jgi:hypothetical protein
VLGEILESIDESVRELWRTLQEWSGERTPFTEKLEKDLHDRLRDEHQAEVEKLHDGYREKIETLTRQQRQNEAERLRRRLLQLAGRGEG